MDSLAGKKDKDYSAILRKAFETTLSSKYQNFVPPNPLVTPTGIRHLDALLGGGITSSSYVFLSSTPETGKSTTAMQFCSMFQTMYPNAICVYIDAESAAGGTSSDIQDRIQTFNIKTDKFLYVPVVMNIKEIFDLIADFVNLKRDLNSRVGTNCELLIIWDSIAATPSSKDQDADDPNSVKLAA